MANKSKFQKGMKVKSILNKFTEYEIIEVRKNSLVVSPVGMSDIKHTCQKSFFEVVEGNTKTKQFFNSSESVIKDWINYRGLQKYDREEEIIKADPYLKENFNEEDIKIVKIHYI